MKGDMVTPMTWLAHVSCMAVLAGLTACSFDTSNSGHPSDPHDASFDATINTPDAAPDAKVCDPSFDFALLNIDTCDLPTETHSLVLNSEGDYELNTDDGTLFSEEDDETTMVPFQVVPQEDGPDLFVTKVQTLQIATYSTLHVVGERPLLLVSMSDILINGELYGRGFRNTSGPASDRDEDCLGVGRGANGVMQTDNNTNSAGSGGGGGGFGQRGGAGSKIASAAGGALDSLGGALLLSTTLEPLRGGCAGGKGGGAGGLGGGAGGAIQLVAVDTFTLNGKVSVSGGGGRGTTSRHSGGGGGGSGGGVLVQARMLVGAGLLTANGGGGGKGSRTATLSVAGENGSTGTIRAAGGSGGSSGGNGGNGGVLAKREGSSVEVVVTAGLPGMNNGSDAAGGGGGGGGAGQIRLVLHP